jgi:hypothetical protein
VATLTEARGSQRGSMLTDEALIQAFVDGFMLGQTPLMSNPNLRIEPLRDSLQLLTVRGGVLATAQMHETPMSIIVRQMPGPWEILHEALTHQSFFPLAKARQEGCYVYRFCEPPEGYDLYCTTAKDLWRACWGRGFGVRPGIPLDLLVWGPGAPGQPDSWQALRGMDLEHGQLIIKVLGRSFTVAGQDLVVWAKKDEGYRGGLVNERSKPDQGQSTRFRN